MAPASPYVFCVESLQRFPAREVGGQRRIGPGEGGEAAVDAFEKTLTWEPHVGKIDRPFLCVAGGADELAPLEHTDRFVAAIKAQKQLLVYQDTRHSVVGPPAASS